jgi:hypothetical protein
MSRKGKTVLQKEFGRPGTRLGKDEEDIALSIKGVWSKIFKGNSKGESRAKEKETTN